MGDYNNTFMYIFWVSFLRVEGTNITEWLVFQIPGVMVQSLILFRSSLTYYCPRYNFSVPPLAIPHLFIFLSHEITERCISRFSGIMFTLLKTFFSQRSSVCLFPHPAFVFIFMVQLTFIKYSSRSYFSMLFLQACASIYFLLMKGGLFMNFTDIV